MKSALLSLLILAAFPLSTSPQNLAGSIEGSVRDRSGAPVADATVYAFSTEDMRRRMTTATDSNGRFVFSRVVPGTYDVHAYKEKEGYADSFFSFFANGNKESWKRVKVYSGPAERVLIELGPKYATLKLSIRDERGNPSGGSLKFIRIDDPARPYGRGAEMTGDTVILVPPVPFRFEIEKEGYGLWHSKLITLQSGQTISITARLKRHP